MIVNLEKDEVYLGRDGSGTVYFFVGKPIWDNKTAQFVSVEGEKLTLRDEVSRIMSSKMLKGELKQIP